jgi:hypothetical protein
LLPLVPPPARPCIDAWTAKNPSKPLNAFKTKNPKPLGLGVFLWFGVKPIFFFYAKVWRSAGPDQNICDKA